VKKIKIGLIFLKYYYSIFLNEKGKPTEKLGRKATGLKLYTTHPIGSRRLGCHLFYILLIFKISKISNHYCDIIELELFLKGGLYLWV